MTAKSAVALVWEEGTEMSSRIINLTPNALQILTDAEGGSISGSVGFGRAARQGTFRLVAELPSEGVARAATSSVPSGMVEVNGEEVPVTKTGFGEVQDLPEPQVGVLLVVSKITADAASAGGRPVDDLLIVGEAVRDEAGKILGVTGFGRLETTDALQLAIARLDKLITLDVVNLVSNGDGQAALPIIEAATLVTEVARKS